MGGRCSIKWGGCIKQVTFYQDLKEVKELPYGYLGEEHPQEREDGRASAKVLRQEHAKDLVCLWNYNGAQCGGRGVNKGK